jgi:hypothetical protein
VRFKEHVANDCAVLSDEDNSLVCMARTPAEATLLAAAPELLAIVQYLADAQRDGASSAHFSALFSDDDITTLGHAVTAAIAKAAGEEGSDA